MFGFFSKKRILLGVQKTMSKQDKKLEVSLNKHWSKIEKDFSAKVVVTKGEGAIIFVLIVSIVSAHFLTETTAVYTSVMSMNLLYLFANSYRLLLFFQGLRILEHSKTVDHIINLKDSELPKYTILMPVYKEGPMMPELVEAMSKLDYPKNKLQILILTEEDDEETAAALKKIKPPKNFQVVVVPHSLPKTKPKACNYGLTLATGDIITIYDAEDKTEVDQLKRVVQKFKRLPDDVVCLQARLCFFNAHENWITNMFAIEYANLFNFVLPAMSGANYPIPLGGTSNHFKAPILKELNGWDPYNVTEDADLGLRIAARGYKIRMVYSFTPEEATCSFGAWTKQRSRWIKGYFQTFLVYMRHPVFCMKQYGFKGFMFFVYMIFLAPFMLLMTPVMAYLSIKIILGYYPFMVNAELVLRIFTWFNMLYGVLSLIFMSYVVKEVQNFQYIRLWWTYPIYFGMHVYASILAIISLIRDPHKWEKTTHGVTKLKH